MDLVYGFLDFLNGPIALLFAKSGLSQISPDSAPFQIVKGSLVSLFLTVPSIMYWVVIRIPFLRALWDRRCKAEGYWLEKIHREDRNFVSIVRIKFHNFSSRRYTLYGEALDFAGRTDGSSKKHASFKSDYLHFSFDEEITITFRYESTSHESEGKRGVGIAQYVFNPFHTNQAHGFFVGVLDGSNKLEIGMKIDSFELQKLNFTDWLLAVSKSPKLFTTFRNWKFFLAEQSFNSLSKVK